MEGGRYVCVLSSRRVGSRESAVQEHQATVTGWNQTGGLLRRLTAKLEGVVVVMGGIGLRRKSIQGGGALDFQCVNNVTVAPCPAASAALQAVSLEYQPLTEVGYLSDWSWVSLRGHVLETVQISEKVLEVKIVDSQGNFLAMHVEQPVRGTIEGNLVPGARVEAIMVQVSQRYGNVAVRAESCVRATPALESLPTRCQPIRFDV